MTARTRLWVLLVSTPVIAFAIVGGYLGQAVGRDETIRQLRIFEDVAKLVEDNYVEPVKIVQVMSGAMRGLADALDADSAFLTADLVKAFESNASPGPAEIGVELRRQYYLRVVAVREGSPAAKAGLRAGDYIRAIDGRATRDMSAYEGARLLKGAVGSKVALLVLRGNTTAASCHHAVITYGQPHHWLPTRRRGHGRHSDEGKTGVRGTGKDRGQAICRGPAWYGRR